MDNIKIKTEELKLEIETICKVFEAKTGLVPIITITPYQNKYLISTKFWIRSLDEAIK